MDLSFLDQPEILEIVFPLVYSPFYSQNISQDSLSSGVTGFPVEVAEGITIKCGFWISSPQCPSILYFHGNGETAESYQWIAPFYNQKGINLFVTDYRGYGSSNGRPTISNMIGDTEAIYHGFTSIIKEKGLCHSFFVMGRSLGSMPAIELACNKQHEINGLIIESGTASNLRRLWNYLVINGRQDIVNDESSYLNGVKIRQFCKPTLIIHGEYDRIISVEEGKELYRNSGADDKSLLIIPGAGHNDIMLVESDLYFRTIAEFIKARS